MDNFKIIYKILRALEKNLDYEDLEISTISAETLNITYERWEQLMIMLVNEGFITGIVITKDMGSAKAHIARPINPTITLKGLEYLSENSTMKKIANATKGIVELIKP